MRNKNFNLGMLLELLILLTVAGLAYKSGYFKGVIMQREADEVYVENYKNVKQEFEEYKKYCDKNHYELLHYGC